jgi:hypothetical protein
MLACEFRIGGRPHRSYRRRVPRNCEHVEVVVLYSADLEQFDPVRLSEIS